MAEEFDPKQSAVDYGESLLASQAENRKKARKRRRQIERVNQVLGVFSVADQFLTRSARNRAKSFEDNMLADKAQAITRFNSAKTFDEKDLQQYRDLDPAVDFNDEAQWKEGGLIWDAISKGHASAIKAQYATGSEGSFDPAVNPITKMTAYEAYIDEVNRRTTNSAIALRAKYNKFKPILEQKTDQLVSKEIIDARYKRLIEEGKKDILSARNTSSLRKLLGKVGMFNKEDSNLAALDVNPSYGEVRINRELHEQHKNAITRNSETFKTYESWLQKSAKEKGFQLATEDLKDQYGRGGKRSEQNFNQRTRVKESFELIFYQNKQGKPQTSEGIPLADPSENAHPRHTGIDKQKVGEGTPLSNLSGYQGADDDKPITFSELWSKLDIDDKVLAPNQRTLIRNAKHYYNKLLLEDDKRLTESNNGKPTYSEGSPEMEAKALDQAIRETLAYDLETDSYRVIGWEDIARENKESIPDEKEIPITHQDGRQTTLSAFLNQSTTDVLENKDFNSSKKQQGVIEIYKIVGEEHKDKVDEWLGKAGYSNFIIDDLLETEYTAVDIESGRAEKLEQTVDIRETLAEMEEARLSLPELRRLKRILPAAEYKAKKEASDRATAFLKSFENQFGSLTLKTSPEPYASYFMPYKELKEQQILNLDPDEVQNFLDNYDYTSTEVKKKMINRETQTEPTEKFIKHLADREGSLKKHNKVYLDSLGIPTVGVGHKLVGEEKTKYKVGDTVPDNILNEWLKKDSQTAWLGALKQSKELGIDDLDFIEALASVNFQLGTSWFKIHKNTWKFLQTKEYEKAAKEAADSLWFKQSPTRVKDFQAAIRNL